MGFRTGSYMTVWSVEQGHGNSMKVRLSSSRKNKEGVFEQDFSGFCSFFGSAAAQAEKLREKDRIKLGDVDVSTYYDKEKKKEYVTYKVFSFENANGSPSAPTGGAQQTAPKRSALDENPANGDNDEDGELPF